jgi:hypothetical protein
MENRSDPPMWGTDYVMRPVSTSTARPSPLRGSVFEMPPVTSDLIRKLAKDHGMTEEELVRLGLALAELLAMAKRDGNRLAIVDDAGKVVHQIVGL